VAPILTVQATDVEAWFEVLALTPQGKREKPLKWPTIDKINSVRVKFLPTLNDTG